MDIKIVETNEIVQDCLVLLREYGIVISHATSYIGFTHNDALSINLDTKLGTENVVRKYKCSVCERRFSYKMQCFDLNAVCKDCYLVITKIKHGDYITISCGYIYQLNNNVAFSFNHSGNQIVYGYNAKYTFSIEHIKKIIIIQRMETLMKSMSVSSSDYNFEINLFHQTIKNTNAIHKFRYSPELTILTYVSELISDLMIICELLPCDVVKFVVYLMIIAPKKLLI